MALSSISSIFQNSLLNCVYASRYKPKSSHYDHKSSYMVIPIFQETFEVPTLALFSFLSFCNNAENTVDSITSTEALCVNLTTEGFYSSYTSLPSKVKDSLNSEFMFTKLMVLKTKEHRIYYVTEGTILDNNLKPLMMLSWEIKQIKSSEGTIKYKFIRPILRIDPIVITYKGDELLKYIANKIIPEALMTHGIQEPIDRIANDLFIRDRDCYFSIKIEIDENPFLIKDTSRPSVSTTNRELLDTALTYLDDVI